MVTDPDYQMWSALRRTGMEMRQQAGRALVLRQAEALRDRARALNAGAHHAASASTLQLDPTVTVPRYQSELDNHCMPGRYFVEYVDDDVCRRQLRRRHVCHHHRTLRAPSRWRRTRHGALVAGSQAGMGAAADSVIGCGLGHNTLPLARAFPQAEVVAVDLAAPMLRYGHARAVGLGVAGIRFQQANAESLPFAAGAFDFIYSTMFLHETSHAALRNIFREARRLLAPGGLHVHLEQPPYRGMDLFEQFLR
jgi:SAM-dependent methyltransferase